MKAGTVVYEDIIQKIEEIRKELMDLGMEKGLQDPQVIKKSQILDELINQYLASIRGQSSKLSI
jgi:hypothetical protein